jgi:hypothetical protein
MIVIPRVNLLFGGQGQAYDARERSHIRKFQFKELSKARLFSPFVSKRRRRFTLGEIRIAETNMGISFER